MKIFVVVSQMMNGKDAVAIFSEQDKARAFVESKIIPNGDIESYDLDVDDKSKPVFAAHRYLQRDDIYYFIGLYLEFDSAKRAAGENSLVLTKHIDERLNEII